MKIFKNYSLVSVLLMIFLSGILISSIFIWLLADEKYSDFGLNLLTELLGVIITIFIIDHLIKRREYNKQLPLKVAIYKDIFKFFGKYITIFHSSFLVSVPREIPKSLEEFISAEEMGSVFKYLDLNTSPRVTPKRTWYIFFMERRKSIIQFGSIILERYKDVVDPDVFNAVHSLVNGNFVSTLEMMPTIIDHHKKNGKSCLMSFRGFHVKFSDEEYNSLRVLNSWIKKNYVNLNKFDNTIQEYNFTNKFSPRDESCKLPDELII